MTMDSDLSIYLGVFIDEVEEHIQILEQELLQLEQEPENIETIQSIFRAAHTLKGSSAAMDMDKMKQLTHGIENIFDSIRTQRLKVNTNIMNVLFEALDKLKLLKATIITGTMDKEDIFEIMTKLDSVHALASEAPSSSVEQTPSAPQDSVFPNVIFDEYQTDMIESAFELGMKAVAVYVALNEKTVLKSVRAFLIHNNLKEIGEIIASFPATEVIEDEKQFEGNLVFVVLTEEKNKDIFNVVNSISDLKTIHLTELTTENLAHFTKTTESKEEISNPTQQLKVPRTVRIDIDRLEGLMNLVGELVISQTRLADVHSHLADRYPNDAEIESFQEVTTHFGQIIGELQEGMMKTRMLPIEQLFNRFPRMVRDVAQKAAKEIKFVLEEKETELDRNLIEEIADPIIHLLRNSIDHGIELPEVRENLGKKREGTVTLKAAHEESHIVISISDDGYGIDAEKIKQSALKKQLITVDEATRLTEKELIYLIFKSGFSTAQEITELSGRGVGMDIVRTHIENLNGVIDIETASGKGTTFTIKLPLTLAIIRSLLVQIGEKKFAIPLANVQEIIRLEQADIKMVQKQEVALVRDRVLPLVRLHKRLHVSEADLQQKKRLFVVVIGLAEKRVGLIIDKTLGNQEIVIKSLGKYIGTPKYIAGATIMGDGKVALILDVGSIVLEEGVKETLSIPDSKNAANHEEMLQLATFKLSDEEYGIEIEKVNDIITVPHIRPVINSPASILGMMNLRGKLIPVMDLKQRLNKEKTIQSQKSRIMVVNSGGQQMGLLVDQVTQVLKVNKQLLENTPQHENEQKINDVKGICHFDERLILLLEIEQIIDTEKLHVLKTDLQNLLLGE